VSEGEVIVDNYKLLTTLATGQTTQVWEVIDQNNGEKYAMKLLLPDAFKDAAQKATLKFEAKVMESLDHPNIIKFHKLFMGKNHGYLVMELFKAPNLKSQTQGDLLVLHLRLKRLIEQVAQGMAHFHDKGWIHKDLKPDNILFSKSAELRIIDFSLSAKLKQGMLSNLGMGKKLIQGTRTYMAPEQIRCKKLGAYTDIYNFGIAIFEMLTGRSPYAGSTPNDLLKKHLSEQVPAPSMHNPNVSPEMDRVVMKMMAKKPENRQKTFSEVLSEIRNISLFKESPESMMEQRETDKENEGLKEASLNARRSSRTDAAQSNAKAVATAAEATTAKPAPTAPQVGPIRIPGAPPPGGVPPGVAPSAQPGSPPPGMVPGRPPQVPAGVVAASGPGVPPGMPPRPGVPPGMAPPAGMPPGARPPGMVPPGMMPPGQPPRPGMPPQNLPPGARPPGAMPPGTMPPGAFPPGSRPPNAPPGAPPRPGMPPGMAPPPGGPRPAGAPVPPGGIMPQRPPGGVPPGMPPRPGMPAVASGPAAGPAPGGPRPPGMPPPGMPGGPRPGGPGAPPPGAPVPGMRPPMGMPPPGQAPRPGGPFPGPGLPPGARPPGAPMPVPGGAARPQGPGGMPPRAPAPPPSDAGNASLDDFKIS
jgi:serine/threonine protein kinase